MGNTELIPIEYERMLNYSFDMICTAGVDGYFKYLNPAWEKVLGYSKEEMLSRPFFDFVHPDDQAKTNAEVSKLSAGIQTVGFENRYRHKDGSIRHLEWTATPDTRGLLYCVVRDITERKRVEKALRESEQRYKSLFNNNHSVMLLIDLENADIVDANPAAISYYGWSHKELTSKKITDINTLSEEQIFQEMEKAKLEQRRHFIFRHRLSNGDIRDVEVYSGPIQIHGQNFLLSIIHDITVRKQAERVIEKFFEQPMNIHIVAGFDGIINRVNTGWQNILGYSKKELEGTFIYDHIHPDDLAPTIKEMEKLGKGVTTFYFENRYRHKNGSYRLLAWSAITSLEDQLIYAVASDITDRKRAEEAVRKSEEIMRSVLETSPVGISIYDQTGQCFVANDSVADMIGATKEQVLQQNYNNIESWKISGTLDKAKNAIKENISKRFELIVESTFGKLVWLDCYLVPFSSGRLLLMAHDITERKRAEEALTQERKQMEVILSSLHTGLSLLNPDMTIAWVNQKTREMFPGSEPVGQLCHVFYESRATICEDCQTQLAFMTGKVCENEQLVPATGRWYNIIAQPIKDKNGRVMNVLEAITDITERKRAEEKKKKLEATLMQAQKMESIGTLAGGIAHDFNNILSPILIHTDMALADIPDNSPIRFHLKNVFKAGVRASDLVQQILTFSRQSEEDLQAVKISLIIKEALKLLRASLPSSIEIRQRIEAKSDTVFADPSQIHQVLMNLCTNAAHSMREKGGVLDVSLQNEYFDADRATQYPELNIGAYLRLSVKDTGCGIDNSVLENIMEPYFTTKTKGEGTGLGLAVVHGIVKSCKGAINVESEPGKGSTFHLFFPIIEGDLFEQTKSKIQIPMGTERILFVDDEESITDAVKTMLEGLGYKVTARTSSIEAFEAFRNNPEHFDLVITDMTMPNMTGAELAEKIMKIQPDIPIILCTGFSGLINEEEAKKMGINAFVMKPIVRSKMAQTIRVVIEEKK